jgi:drug/metabolite transporter (DMT)-like permease
LKTGRTFWFIVAALCIAVAALIFAGRTMLLENLGDPSYRALISTAYVLLGATAASLTKAFSVGHKES